MDPKIFEEKLSEVADWHFQKHQGQSVTDASGYNEKSLVAPVYIHVDKIKPIVCEHTGREQRCQFKIYWRPLNPSNPKGELVRIQKCETCGGLVTPKGRYIDLDGKRYDYPRLILQKDQEP
jgi:hypothetical protein